jgi:hypothetical protein
MRVPTPGASFGGASSFSTPATSPSPFASPAAASNPSPFASPAAASNPSPFASPAAASNPSPFSERKDSGPKKQAKKDRKQAQSGRKKRGDARNEKKSNRHEKRRKGSKRKRGLPLVPIAVGTAGLIVSLGVLLIFFVMPRNKANKLFESARGQERAGELLTALETLNEIERAFMPNGVPMLTGKINNQLRARTVEWIKKIESLVDEDKLKQAEDKLIETKEKSLPEDSERVEEKRALIAAARECREARELAKSEEFKEALEKVRTIDRKNLTENNLGIEDDIISLLNTYIRKKKTEIIPVAQDGNNSRAQQMITELEEKCDACVAPRIDALKREIKEIFRKRELTIAASKNLGQIERLIKNGRYLEAQMLIQQIRQQNPDALSAVSKLQSCSKIIGNYFSNRWQQTIKTIVARLKAGNKESARAAFKKLKVFDQKNQIRYFFMGNKPGLIRIFPEDSARQQFNLIVDEIEKKLKNGTLRQLPGG